MAERLTRKALHDLVWSEPMKLLSARFGISDVALNNFDSALLVREGQILAVEKVSARGREAPLLGTLEGRDAVLKPAAAEKV